ncbi:tyrosine/serine/threonine protein phosphatase [Exserohilum turcicum]
MVQTSARTFMPMPSFGAVFGGEHHKGHADGNGSHLVRPATSPNTNSGAPFSSFHLHSESRDSHSTASSDNSPTTTISTMDSSSVTDPSPGVSPESPHARTVAPLSFVADFRSRRTEQSSGDAASNTFFELQRPTTPAKKPRNLKNLGINTASSLGNLRAHTPAPIAVAPKEKNSSAPPSPLFIKPPTPPKRRPSNLSLTISTPGAPDNKPVRLLIPSTPSFNRPPLRHFQSSPSLPLCSTANPLSGPQLPPLRPVVSKPSGLAEVPFEMEEEEDQEPNFDVPQSREEKPAAYPNGPICIYEAGVYLYFEPTAVQATTFDVIINVASEVKNPFTASTSQSQKDIDARRVDGPPAENIDFATLSQRPKQSFGMDDNSPTTPKAMPPVMQTIQPREVVIEGKTYKTPEYIHMPWEHNTDIVPDLHKLVRMIDERVQQGKRVLIHCQCGVSRSASLIVAYGLYKDPQMSVQEAYDRAKKRSKWIGPNMNLIMQLQEFRNSLLRQNESRSYHNQGYNRRSAGLPTGTNKFSSYDRDSPSGSRTPRTAPLPPECSDMSMQRASTGNMMAISPGPLSAPTGAFSPGFRRSWDSSPSHFDLASQPDPSPTSHVDPQGPVVPMVSVTSNDLPTIHAEDASDSDVAPDHLDDFKQPAFPNFSRQLRLRPMDDEDEGASGTEQRLLAPLKPFGMEPLKSPAVASFNIPDFPSYQSSDNDIMSPIKTSFDNPWPPGYDSDSDEPEPALLANDSVPTISTHSPDSHMPGFTQDDTHESYGPLSPNATSFHLGQPTLSKHFGGSNHPIASDIASPVKTHFPQDVFGDDDKDQPKDDLTSPRATEFHMTPLKPRVADEDPFGLTSPTRGEFNPFDRPRSILTLKGSEQEDRRPSFQAILPPAHQTFNGFASLDGTAQTHTIFESPVPLAMFAPKQFPLVGPRVDSLSNSPARQALNHSDPHTPTPAALPQVPPSPRSPTETFLATPGKAIKTRFSSPNIREKRHLQRLQTEIQSKLPRASVPQHAADDLDALMSPRAEEFTRNPFRIELQSPGEDASPVSSDETIRDGRNGHFTWEEPIPTRQWTPEKATADPRSPVQTGGSPIVRNIWDVL